MKRTLFVNVYKAERCYGGSEEGGWWYTSYSPIEFEVAECECDLPISEWPIQDQDGRLIGWHAEIDTWLGHHNYGRSTLSPTPCPCVAKYDEFEQKWTGYRDEWYPQQSDDDSEPHRGESFSSGQISISIELMKGVHQPEYAPMYS